ncbi:hypothetical protein LWI29_013987 [Acer saccharum]|uniref:Uncharacterized protein n=1 Tax=Acer saccharum TaxID=4024 RepID=A0AA39RH87_ACESA|nr:hypothetical protein LWI29_013987 [Acer saccharum]
MVKKERSVVSGEEIGTRDGAVDGAYGTNHLVSYSSFGSVSGEGSADWVCWIEDLVSDGSVSLSSIKFVGNFTIAVIKAEDPIGKLTMGDCDVSIWVNIVESTVIWSVALLSRI